MKSDIFFAVWYLLPAAFANMTPIFVAKLPGLNKWNLRLDFGKKYKGSPVFGEHKTWRGLICGMIIATLILALQKQAVLHSDWLQSLTAAADYRNVSVFILGPLLGLGALGGDAIESFFKRRRGIASGKPWLIFDQLDYILGAILVTLPFGIFHWTVYAWMVAIWFGMHLLASYVGWLLRLKDAPI